MACLSTRFRVAQVECMKGEKEGVEKFVRARQRVPAYRWENKEEGHTVHF